MEISLGQLPYVFWAISFLLSLSAVVIFVQTISIRKNVEAKRIEMERKPVSVLVEELEEQKLAVSKKLGIANSLFCELLEALSNEEYQARQISAGLPPPNFEIDDDENLKTAIREARDKQYEIILRQHATTPISKWEWFGSRSDGEKPIRSYNKLMIGAFNAEFDMAREKNATQQFRRCIQETRIKYQRVREIGGNGQCSYFSRVSLRKGGGAQTLARRISAKAGNPPEK